MSPHAARPARRPTVAALLAAAALLLAPATARAQSQIEPRGPLKDVGIDQRLDAQLPLDLPFRDETGAPVHLGDYFKDRPVILTLVYFRCPMLCSYVLNGMVKALRTINLTPPRDFEIVTVSFDPQDTPEAALQAKQNKLEIYGRDEAAAGWHFLTGDAAAIRSLTAAAGFRYVRDPKTGEFAHGAAIMVATPQGRLARYLYGVEYAPRDLRLALVEASQNRIGSPVDAVLLYCFHYDPMTGRYGLVIMNVLRLAGALTVAALVLGMVLMSRFWRHRHGTSPTGGPGGPGGAGGPAGAGVAP
jgi:protein SCO1